jgi:ADP-heptose:LPS heptosyltransferase
MLLDAESPVVFFANGIGDAILALPALRALTSLFNGRLTLIGHAGSHNVLFRELKTKRQLFLAGGSKCHWQREEINDLAASVGYCDLFLGLVPWQSPSLSYLIERLRPSKTIGFFTEYDVAVPRDYTKHSAQLSFDAVRVIEPDCSFYEYADPPLYPAKSTELAEGVRKSLRKGTRILSVHPETVPEKIWDLNRLAAVLDNAFSSHPDLLVLLISYEEISLPLSRPADRERVIACRGLALIDALCLVNHSDYFLGVDSSMLHAADFGLVPGVGLFGPTSAREFGFILGPHIAIQAESDMGQIGIDCVIEALESLLINSEERSTWYLSGSANPTSQSLGFNRRPPLS